MEWAEGHRDAKKHSNHPNKVQTVSHDRKIGRVGYGNKPNTHSKP
jgi:hypothetical protein